jgi:hypothetical protein
MVVVTKEDGEAWQRKEVVRNYEGIGMKIGSEGRAQRKEAFEDACDGERA